MESGVNYTICVSTQINGHSVAKVSIQTKHDKIEKKFEEDFNNWKKIMCYKSWLGTTVIFQK